MEKMADNFVAVDTNILLYLYNDNESVKKSSFEKISRLKKEGHKLFVTEQTIREFVVAQTNIQKITKNVDFNRLNKDIQYIIHNFDILYPSQQSISYLLELVYKYGLQGKKIHDANIIAVTKSNNVLKILTNNPTDFLFSVSEGLEIITL